MKPLDVEYFAYALEQIRSEERALDKGRFVSMNRLVCMMTDHVDVQRGSKKRKLASAADITPSA